MGNMTVEDSETRPAMGEVVHGLTTKSAKIRALDDAGYARTEIAKYLGIRYQHVRGVLVRNHPLPKRETVRPAASNVKMTRTVSRVASPPLPAAYLLERGFIVVSRWSLGDAGIQFEGKLSTRPAVYAFVVDGVVHYFGVTRKSLHHRISAYIKSPARQTTNTRIRPLIRAALEAGQSVEIIAVAPEPSEWNGLPVNQVAGLELGLIERFKPPWNVMGTGFSNITVHDI